MGAEEKLAQVLAEFARILGTDFSIGTILDRLVTRVVDVLPVTAAGVMVMGDDDELHFLAASNATIRAIEVLQNTYDEGPCLEAYRSGSSVAVPDLSDDQRFPRFSPRALGAGLAAVFTFPMRLDGRRFGALDLYRDSVGALDAGDMAAAQVLADVAAAYIVNAQARNAAADSVERLRHASLHDPLTGLVNRTLFAELLEVAVSRARRSHLVAAVLFVDLDRFKTVNDRYGHHVGDQVLVTVAERLCRVLRPGDDLARLSGDEFVILCQDLKDPAQAELVAHRVATALAEPIELAGRRVQLTASVGIAFSGPGQDIPESLLRDADFAMYEAKAAGGGHHRVIDRTARLAADHRSHLEDDLRAALRAEKFQLAYQPIIHADDGALVAVEALLRWQRPDGGPVAPDVVIPIAERLGLIVPLGQWVLRHACEQFVRWRSAHGPVVPQLAVNVSAHQVIGPEFARTVARTLADTGMEPEALCLEVTESVFLHDAPRARAILGEVKDIGVRLSLDDFGTGYSSLTYLQRFPFDGVKVSGSFIADLTGPDPAAHAIVSSVVDLAHALGLSVVAEGIETQHQLDTVIDLGADLAQGFLMSRPLLQPDFEGQILHTAAHSSTGSTGATGDEVRAHPRSGSATDGAYDPWRGTARWRSPVPRRPSTPRPGS